MSFLRLCIFFLGGRFWTVHSKVLWRTRIGNCSWPTGSNHPGAPQTLSDAIEEENFEFDVPWDSQKRWKYKGKTIGWEEKCGKFLLWSWKIFGLPKLSFWLFQDCISAFFCPDSFPSGHVFCWYLGTVFQERLRRLLFRKVGLGERTARMNVHLLMSGYFPPQHGDMHGNNQHLFEKAKKKIKVLTSLELTWVFPKIVVPPNHPF